ncbi:Amidophosphoribosyltransferase 1 [Abeliophyllum distichum]|uniref:Amidophosphoribosyltransferase 1 n=1 Tax=Abeliophyllum distichum TaxID=126358 RepID=A0ABD1QF55_9LAMI
MGLCINGEGLVADCNGFTATSVGTSTACCRRHLVLHGGGDNNILHFKVDDDKPCKECGVVGIYGDPETLRFYYLSLHALQHYGQEGSRIVCIHDIVPQSVIGVVLVLKVFDESKLDNLPGILPNTGHVGYSIAGCSMLKNVQHFAAAYIFG